MTKSLIEKLPEEIARLEAKYGSDTPYVKDLKRQLDGMISANGLSLAEIWHKAAYNFPPAEPTPKKPRRKTRR